MLTHINNSGTQSRLDFTLCVGVCVALCQHPQPAPTIGDTTTLTKRISMGVYTIQALELWELAGDVGSYTPPYRYQLQFTLQWINLQHVY